MGDSYRCHNLRGHLPQRLWHVNHSPILWSLWSLCHTVPVSLLEGRLTVSKRSFIRTEVLQWEGWRSFTTTIPTAAHSLLTQGGGCILFLLKWLSALTECSLNTFWKVMVFSETHKHFSLFQKPQLLKQNIFILTWIFSPICSLTTSFFTFLEVSDPYGKAYDEVENSYVVYDICPAYVYVFHSRQQVSLLWSL